MTRQTIMIIILIVLAVGAGIYWLITQSGGSTSTTDTTITETGIVPSISLPSVDVNLSDNVLKDERFVNLQEPPTVNLEVGETGKSNPFIP